MPLASRQPDWIYHLALRNEWMQAFTSGAAYRRSTLAKSLEDEGFIHCSFAHPVQHIADLVYRGREDVLLLSIDPSRLHAEVRVEDLQGGDQLFPHIYGALPLEAVVDVKEVPVDTAGRLTVEALLARP